MGSNLNILSVLVYPDLSHSSFVLSIISGPSRYLEKHLFWDNLANLADSISKPWVSIGDFNAVSSQREKRGGQLVACFSHFGLNSLINDFGLIDLGFNGNPFTWNKGRQGQTNIRKLLDRSLANRYWRLLFPHFLSFMLLWLQQTIFL